MDFAILCKQKIRKIIFNVDCTTVPCHFMIGREIERPLFMIPMYAEDRDSVGEVIRYTIVDAVNA